MRALTVHNPWAYAIAKMNKRVENRGWSTKYRGPLLITAGVARKSAAYFEDFVTRYVVPDCGYCAQWPGYEHLDYGTVVAVAQLVDIVPPTDTLLTAKRVGDPERFLVAQQPWRDHGSYAWCLANVFSVPPGINVRGMQGLWKPSAATIRAVTRAVREPHPQLFDQLVRIGQEARS